MLRRRAALAATILVLSAGLDLAARRSAQAAVPTLGPLVVASSTALGEPVWGGNQATDVSPDGRWVLMDSSAAAFWPPVDDGPSSGLVLKDLQTGAVDLIAPPNANPVYGKVSDDGSLVAYRGVADGGGVFVVHRSTGTTTRIADAERPLDFSADGNLLLFEAGLPTAGTPYGALLLDRTTGSVEVVATGSHASMSADGRFVAVLTQAADGYTADSYTPEIAVIDRLTGDRIVASADANGLPSSGQLSPPEISDDGSVVVFASDDPSLVDGDTNHDPDAPHGWDVFVKDLADMSITRANVSSAGEQAGGGSGGSYGARVSPDGRHVAFKSEASNLVPGDLRPAGDGDPPGSGEDLFVHDRLSRTTVRVNVTNDGAESNNGIPDDFVMYSGGVVFTSPATNLIEQSPPDGAAYSHVYSRHVGLPPGAPTDVRAVGGQNGTATVSWVAPTVGDPVASYVVTASNGATTTVAGDERAALVEGLENGAEYTFSVVATNEFGSSDPSAPSAPLRFTPAPLPPGRPLSPRPPPR